MGKILNTLIRCTGRLGVLHAMSDLLREVLDEGVHLVTGLHRILDHLHGLHEGRAVGGRKLVIKTCHQG